MITLKRGNHHEQSNTAERFIYAEYFIIENGVMWDSMVEIMAMKAA